MSPEPRFLRLFVAVALPADVKAALCDLQRELKKVLPPFSVAWTRPEGMHLTLRFLGSVGESHVPELERSLRGRLEGFGPLDLVCERVGCFPDRRFPRVVWAGVHDAAGRLPKVHELVNQAAEGFAEKPAEPHFVGHATVGRPKHVRRPDAAALARFVDASIRRRFGAWRCGEIELVRSDPSPTGSRYTTIATIALDAAAPGRDEGVRPSARPAYRLLDHTADLAFEVEGADWAGLLGAATAALGDVVLADDGRPADVEVPVAVEGADREDVLVAWLSAAVVAYEDRGLVPRGVRFERLTDREARGVILARRTVPRTEPPDRVVKAVTYHDLRVRPGDDGRPWRATVVLDL